MKSTRVTFDDTVHRDLKVAAAKLGLNMTTLAERALREFLERLNSAALSNNGEVPSAELDSAVAASRGGNRLWQSESVNPGESARRLDGPV